MVVHGDDVVLVRGLGAEGLVDGEQRNVFPGGFADGANELAMLAHVVGDAREVKCVSALRCVNGRALTRLHAVQTDSAATL